MTRSGTAKKSNILAPKQSHRVNSQNWQNLQDFLDRLDRRGTSSLAPSEIHRLEELYCRCLAHLGELRESGHDRHLERVLNDLAARAYGWIYRPAKRTWQDVVLFILFRFSEEFWRRLHYFIVAGAIFAASILIGFLGVGTESKLVDLVLTPDYQMLLKNDIARTAWVSKGLQEVAPPLQIAHSLFFTNLLVAIKCFALGVTFGLGTLVTLVQHGLLIGGLAASFHSENLGLYFWAGLLPHCFLQFFGIILAASGGFIIAYAILVPGLYRRSTVLGAEVKAAAALFMGLLPVSLLAGLANEHVSANPIFPVSIKLLCFLGTVVLLGFYLRFPRFKADLEALLLGRYSAPKKSILPVPMPVR